MTAWETIKAKLTADTGPGTFGEGMEINKAARLFVALRPYLKDWDNEVAVFNADESVGKALTQRSLEKELERGGVL